MLGYGPTRAIRLLGRIGRDFQGGKKGMSETVPVAQQSGYNGVLETRFRAGWIGLFSGENQAKAVQRTLTEINNRGLKVAGLVPDKWNFFARLWWALVAVVSLGFYVRVPNVVVVTEPLTR
jgi:hypothetical protein